MVKRIRPAKHYQRADNAVRQIVLRGRRVVARDLKDSLKHLSALVPNSMVRMIKDGKLRQLKDEVDFGHYREILKKPFARIADVYKEGAQLGVRKINGSFHQARRRVRFRKQGFVIYASELLENTTVPIGKVAGGDQWQNEERVQSGPERGQWTSGGGGGGGANESGGGGSASALMAAQERASISDYNSKSATQTWGSSRVDIGGGQILHTMTQRAASNSRGARRGSQLRTTFSIGGKQIGRSALASLLQSRGFSKAVDVFNFDMFDQDTLDKLRAAQDELIQQLENDARDTIEQIVTQGAFEGLSAEEIVGDIRDMIGLTDFQATAVMNYRRMLETLDPTALQRQLRNTTMDDAIREAIDSGQLLSGDVIDSMVDDYTSNYLDYRASTIAQTESVRAANTGLHDAYSQAIDRGALPADAVTRQWELGDSPCPICESIPDNNPDGVGVDEEFDSDDGPVDDPPVHPNCMCSVNYVTDISMVPEDTGEESGAYDTNVPIEGIG